MRALSWRGIGLALVASCVTASTASANLVAVSTLGSGAAPDGTQAPSAQVSDSHVASSAASDSRFDLAAALVIGPPVGDYGDAVDTGFGLSAYGGYLIRLPQLRLAVGPALTYQHYGVKGVDASTSTFDANAQLRAYYDLPTVPNLALFGDLGLGIGVFRVSSGSQSDSQTHIGAFKLGAGAGYHVTPQIAITGELAYERTPTDGDAAGRITLAMGGSFAS